VKIARGRPLAILSATIKVAPDGSGHHSERERPLTLVR
jgi:hypothetical protein